MTAVEMNERTLDDVVATALFTWGLSFSRSDVEIAISALHNLTDFDGEEIVTQVSEFWNRTWTDLVAGNAVASVYVIMETLRTGRITGEAAALSAFDVTLIAAALSNLAGSEPGDVADTYGELSDVHDDTLDKILAVDGELHRYADLLSQACVRFVENAILLGI
jgi:FlaG/FlaF family flagellin (archaellin)